MADGNVNNDLSGMVRGNVVMARDISVLNIGPAPTELDLDDYLSAAQRAADSHPVISWSGLSAGTVPLSRVYEGQDLWRRSDGQFGDWEQALELHPNLIIVGHPGGGKSSMIRRIAGTLAERQASGDEPSFVPVQIHARALRDGRPLAKAIWQGAMEELGSFLLRDLPPDVFAKAAPGGKPWLVLVDGLDEVPTTDQANQALKSIVEGTRHHFLRFVVATRPLQRADLDITREQFALCDLQPFSLSTLGTFAGRWLRLHGVSKPVEATELLVNHVGRTGIRDWAVQPLAATMLCELLSGDVSQRLPERTTDLYEKYVAKLFTGRARTNKERKTNRDIIVLLERLAAERQFRHRGEPVLTTATRFVQGTSLESSAGDPQLRARALHDLLCRTGMVVAVSQGVEFAHATLEEYLAARYVARRMTDLSPIEQKRTLDQIINSLSWHNPRMAHDRVSQVFDASQVPLFLIELWLLRGKSADSLLAHLVRSWPEHCWKLIRRLRSEGLPIGPEVAAELVVAATNVQMYWLDWLGVTGALIDLDHPEGAAKLLGLIFDGDELGKIRVGAVEEARRSSRTVAVAVSFLVNRSDFPELQLDDDSIEIRDLVPDVDEEETPEGLALVVANPYLPAGVRIHAAAVTIVVEGDQAYLALLAQWPIGNLIRILGEEAEAGVAEAWSVLWRMLSDPALSPESRFDVADELDVLRGHFGTSAFQTLAEDLTLDEEYRQWAAAQTDPAATV